MPKRSTAFQRLVYLVKKHAAQGATVTESKYLRDRITRHEREVDICIEGVISGTDIVISIECRDHKRPADVGWVEQMKAKHENLPTHALVLSSRSGFTNRAQEKARLYGIELLPFKEGTDQVLDHLIGAKGILMSKTATVTPTDVMITVEPILGLPEEVVHCTPNHLLFEKDGKQIGTVKELVWQVLRSEPVAMKFLEVGSEAQQSFEVQWEVRQPLHLEKRESRILRRIKALRITGDCRFEINEFRFREGILGGVRVAWAAGTWMGKDALLVVSEQEPGLKKLSISPAHVTVNTIPAG